MAACKSRTHIWPRAGYPCALRRAKSARSKSSASESGLGRPLAACLECVCVQVTCVGPDGTGVHLRALRHICRWPHPAIDVLEFSDMDCGQAAYEDDLIKVFALTNPAFDWQPPDGQATEAQGEACEAVTVSAPRRVLHHEDTDPSATAPSSSDSETGGVSSDVSSDAEALPAVAVAAAAAPPATDSDESDQDSGQVRSRAEAQCDVLPNMRCAARAWAFCLHAKSASTVRCAAKRERCASSAERPLRRDGWPACRWQRQPQRRVLGAAQCKARRCAQKRAARQAATHRLYHGRPVSPDTGRWRSGLYFLSRASRAARAKCAQQRECCSKATPSSNSTWHATRRGAARPHACSARDSCTISVR